MSIKAVIFDMDGVLVDSMKYHAQAWQKTFEPLGVDISDKEVYMREGEDWRKSTRDFLTMGGYRADRPLIEKVFNRRSRIFEEIFRAKIFKGVKELLRLLHKKGLSLALVTATPYKEVCRMLPEPIVKFFDLMVCGGDTKKGKPYPDPYLKALKKLGIKPDEAIVVENAPYGISSSRSAGIKTIAVATSLPKKCLSEADIIVDSLKDVRKHI